MLRWLKTTFEGSIGPAIELLKTILALSCTCDISRKKRPKFLKECDFLIMSNMRSEGGGVRRDGEEFPMARFESGLLLPVEESAR